MSTPSPATAAHPAAHESHRIRRVLFGLLVAGALSGAGYAVYKEVKKQQGEADGTGGGKSSTDADPAGGGDGDGVAVRPGGPNGETTLDPDDPRLPEESVPNDPPPGDEESGESGDAESREPRLSKASFTEVGALAIYVVLGVMIVASALTNFSDRDAEFAVGTTWAMFIAFLLAVIFIPSFGYGDSPGMWSVLGVAVGITFLVHPVAVRTIWRGTAYGTVKGGGFVGAKTWAGMKEFPGFVWRRLTGGAEATKGAYSYLKEAGATMQEGVKGFAEMTGHEQGGASRILEFARSGSGNVGER